MPDYLLGTSDHELRRLEHQHGVWRHTTEHLLDRVPVRPGARCLDAGCGPGHVLFELRERAGDSGRVVGLDASDRWISHVDQEIASRGWTNVEVRCARLEEADLEPGAYDVIVMRWVLGFLPDPGAALETLAAALPPGGALVVQDYNHEGVSVFPESEGFREVIRATREHYRRSGGDAWIAGRLPGLLRSAGLVLEHADPRVLTGGPESPVATWMDSFFAYHCDAMVESGVLAAEDRRRFLEEWGERQADPDATFFSPIVVGFVARKP
jgi:SAM-dependent methyltransferase